MNYIDYTYTYNVQKTQIADLERENQWLKPFGDKLCLYEISRAFNRNHNIPIDEFSFHNGMKYVENCWKLCVLYNDKIPEEKKDLIMKGYESSLKGIGEMLKDDLKSSGLLIEQNHAIPPYLGGVNFESANGD
ncbi:MAG: hypothetical protein IK025_10030 [Bacteroidales bacterium]|nr:hypothetical protein [Bacteroidales bacterium]